MSMMVFFTKFGINQPQDTAITCLDIDLKDIHLYHKKICSTMFIAFVIARNWKQPRCPSTEELIKKMWYSHTMEYYSVVQSNNILKLAGKCMELDNTILIEVTQTQKSKHSMHSIAHS